MADGNNNNNNIGKTIYTLFRHEAAIVNTHKSTKTQTHKNRDMENVYGAVIVTYSHYESSPGSS